MVNVQIGGKKHGRLVHRLVARTFLGPPNSPEQSLVNHKDGRKDNNYIDNLEYVSSAENSRHSVLLNVDFDRTQTGGCIPVMARSRSTGESFQYFSMAEAARQTGVSLSSISRCCRRLGGQNTGFEFCHAPHEVVRSGLASSSVDEVWRAAVHPRDGSPITDWQVSSHGRVKTSRGTVHLGTAAASGYRVVGPTISGVIRRQLVHRLVAAAFLGPPPDYRLDVHHKDGSKDNNHIGNLEYVTRSENVRHSYASTSRKNAGTALSKPVLVRSVGEQAWRQYASIRSTASALGISEYSVFKGCHSNAGRGMGFEFKFADPCVSGELDGEVWLAAIID